MQMYIKTKHNIMPAAEIVLRINSLPIPLQTKIRSYRSIIKQQCRIEGLSLLVKVLENNKLDSNKYSLANLKYNRFGKPYFDNQINFSISYSDKFVFFGFVRKGLIGIDVEKVEKIEYEIYESFFTPKEWNLISNSPFAASLFLKYWTRKEAVSKTLGYGSFLEFCEFEVIEDLIAIKGIRLRIETQFLVEKYWLSVATNISYKGAFNLIYL